MCVVKSFDYLFNCNDRKGHQKFVWVLIEIELIFIEVYHARTGDDHVVLHKFKLFVFPRSDQPMYGNLFIYLDHL